MLGAAPCYHPQVVKQGTQGRGGRPGCHWKLQPEPTGLCRLELAGGKILLGCQQN